MVFLLMEELMTLLLEEQVNGSFVLKLKKGLEHRESHYGDYKQLIFSSMSDICS
jgi:hypothetical protein